MTEISSEEVMRTLQAFRVDVKEDLTELKGQLTALSFVSPEVYAADRVTFERRVERIESHLGRGVAFVLTAVGAAVLGGVIRVL